MTESSVQHRLPDDLLAAELETEERALLMERHRNAGGSATTVA